MQRRRRYEGVNRVTPGCYAPRDTPSLPHPSPAARNCEHTDRAMLRCMGPQGRVLGVSSTGRQQMSRRSMQRRTDEKKWEITASTFCCNRSQLIQCEIKNSSERSPDSPKCTMSFHLIATLQSPSSHRFLSVNLLHLPTSEGNSFALIGLEMTREHLEIQRFAFSRWSPAITGRNNCHNLPFRRSKT